MKRFVITCVILLYSASVVTAAPTDFVFIIDSTSSMGGEISAVKSGLSDFIDGLDTAAIPSRFAVILYGGAPELVLDFTTSKADVTNAFSKISVSGAVTGFQNNHNVNPEAGLEAIRIALGAAVDNTLRRDNVGGTGGLAFQAGVRKNLILVTDEDSDLPFYAANRFSGQTGTEPPSATTTLASTWQAEVDATANAVIANQAFLNLIINPNNPSRWQYGDPLLDQADADFSNFDRAATLTAYAGSSYAESLVGQVLSDSALIARAFNIGNINNANWINNFFAAKIEETQQDPGPGPVIPAPGAILLGGIGVSIVGWLRRRRTL